MKVGAMLGQATADQEARLAGYGRNLGLAFQIVDDVHDLAASEEVLGKPVASDLPEGKGTMAVMHAPDACTTAARQLVEKVVEERALISVQHEQRLDSLKRYGSIQYAYDAAVEHAESARRAICTFPESEIKSALLFIPEFVVERSN